MLYVVTGMPGAGKTTYVKNNKKSNDIVFDLDYIANALTLEDGKTSNAIKATNMLINPFASITNNIEGDIYIIRVAPTEAEIFLFDKYRVNYLDINTDISLCYKRRKDKINSNTFAEINRKYKQYLNSNHRKITRVLCGEERW